MLTTVKPFVVKSLEVTTTILQIFERQLGLPSGGLSNRHQLLDRSGSEARCIKNPAMRKESRGSAVTSLQTDEKAALGAHTDFGSLSFLHNRLGGLQVLPPGYDSWQYIRPIPGHAICNVGDTLTLFSGGILRSNLHRVVMPPGEQAFHDRWSLVFFLRPGINEHLYPLTEQSKVVADAISLMTDEEKRKFYPNSTAGEWFSRRIKMQRINNRKVNPGVVSTNESSI